MNERAADILSATVEEFIAAGEPVSSALLYRRRDFGIRPAMIRLEMEALQRGGYLSQPYHSSGRVPTDRGLEFFAGRALADVGASPSSRWREFRRKRAWGKLVGAVSAELGSLSFLLDRMSEAFFQSGLDELVGSMEEETPAAIREVIEDFVSLEDRFRQYESGIGDALRIFIGKRSPLTRSERLAVVCGSCGEGGEASLLVVGPKRMDYKKAVRIFRGLEK